MKLLSIHIPTIVGRERQLQMLLNSLKHQMSRNQITFDDIEIITQCDNKEMSIGAKRQILLDRCNAEYCVAIDDDDHVDEFYLYKVLVAIQSRPDCIGYLEHCTIDGQKKISCHSKRYPTWANNVDGYDFVRSIFCKDVIKTDIARYIGFSDFRFGEDHDFSKRLAASGLLKTEVFINEVMYYYEANTLTQEQHNKRYGL